MGKQGNEDEEKPADVPPIVIGSDTGQSIDQFGSAPAAPPAVGQSSDINNMVEPVMPPVDTVVPSPTDTFIQPPSAPAETGTPGGQTGGLADMMSGAAASVNQAGVNLGSPENPPVVGNVATEPPLNVGASGVLETGSIQQGDPTVGSETTPQPAKQGWLGRLFGRGGK